LELKEIKQSLPLRIQHIPLFLVFAGYTGEDENPKKDYTEALISDSIRMASADDLSFGTIKVK
jgi:hypothetical protein